jgi:hypothetical protein
LIADLAVGLHGTFLEGQLILGGSSGLFAFTTATPAFTEDLDFLVREDLVITRGAEIIELLRGQGYERQPDTPTFTAPGRPTFDLVGYSLTDATDHLSPPAPLRVMVYGDLGLVLGHGASVEKHPSGVVSLSPAAFCVVKLMTVRVEKGSKDKLQALLVIGERAADLAFRRDLTGMLGRFDRDRRTDAIADAQMAFLALQRDPEFHDRGAEGYRAFLDRAAQGFRALEALGEENPHA